MAAVTTRALTGLGTPEAVWARAAYASIDLDAVPVQRVVLVAPHPDDEVLGAGGTVAQLADRGLPVLLLAVTDGEASHPGRGEELRQVRPQESAAALRALSLGEVEVHRLGQPDGAVNAAVVSNALVGLLDTGDLVLAPWSGEGHPDHDAVGRASEEACREVGSTLWSYLVWTWHWADPETDVVPWARARRVDLPPAIRARKARAIDCFTSQTTGAEPILPHHVLARFHRDQEVFLLP